MYELYIIRDLIFTLFNYLVSSNNYTSEGACEVPLIINGLVKSTFDNLTVEAGERYDVVYAAKVECNQKYSLLTGG